MPSPHLFRFDLELASAPGVPLSTEAAGNESDASREREFILWRQLLMRTPNGIEDAVNNAITRAGKTIRNMKWFEVAELRGHLENNKVADWQVTVKIGFTLDT
jgi:dodecin